VPCAPKGFDFVFSIINSELKLAQVPAQSECTHSAYLAAATPLKNIPAVPAPARSQTPRSQTEPYLRVNRHSRIPGTQPHEYEYRIPPDEPCIRQEHVHIRGYCIHKMGEI